MLAARGTVMVSRLRYRRCRSVGGRINVAPAQSIGIKHPYSSHLFYSLSFVPSAAEEIHPLSNSNSHMSRSRSRHFAVLSLPQARHALVIYLSVMISLLFQRQRNDMDLITGQLPSLVLSAKDVCSTIENREGVVGAREKSGAGDSFECRAERLGGLSEAVCCDGATFDGGGEDLLGCYQAGHCCWVHLGRRWRMEDNKISRWGWFAKGYCPFKRGVSTPQPPVDIFMVNMLRVLQNTPQTYPPLRLLCENTYSICIFRNVSSYNNFATFPALSSLIAKPLYSHLSGSL